MEPMKTMEAPPRRSVAPGGPLWLSVTWGYLFGLLLMLFLLLVLVPEFEGPAPWDPVAFREGMLEMFANFRILDDLATLGIIRVADVGRGLWTASLELLGVSNRRFGWTPFYLAIALVGLSLLLRGLRQRILAGHCGFSPAVPGQLSSYFYGRGLNLFFPFGPGDLGVVRTLESEAATGQATAAEATGGKATAGAAAAGRATTMILHARAFELLAILLVLVGGFVYLGWGGALTVVVWTLLLVTAVVSLTRPLGWWGREGTARRGLPEVWGALGGRNLGRLASDAADRPAVMLGLLLLSVVALSVEILGYWMVKQAFSSPLDQYVLMKDLGLIEFCVVVAVAGITRIVPYTFASFGVYETVSTVMFWVFGESFLSGATVSILDSLLLNSLTLLAFVVATQIGRFPSVLETWGLFYRRSADHVPRRPEGATEAWGGSSGSGAAEPA